MSNRQSSRGTDQSLAVPEISASALASAGARLVKRHPLLSGTYALGLLICLFFTGFSLTELQRREFYNDISIVDYEEIDRAHEAMLHWSHRYQQSRGFFFTCNEACMTNFREFESAKKAHQSLKKSEAEIVSAAKSKIGVFSELGVQETRAAFWERYSQGKGFAERQTKFDAAFFGFRAMMRDESLMEYAVTMLFRMLFNFTLGVIATVMTFVWSSVGVIASFQSSPIAGLLFFIGALIAALTFAVSWLGLIASAVGGTVYAAMRLAAANVRIEDGGTRFTNIHNNPGRGRND